MSAPGGSGGGQPDLLQTIADMGLPPPDFTWIISTVEAIGAVPLATSVGMSSRLLTPASSSLREYRDLALDRFRR